MKCKNFSQLPSTVFGESDSLAAWMLDNAVNWFGLTIENALAERVEVKLGSKTESKPRYSLTLLLNPGFKLPKPVVADVQGSNPWAAFAQWVGKRDGLVKRYGYVGPRPVKEEEEDV